MSRILLLDEAAGSGHKRVARILAQALSEVDGVEVIRHTASPLFEMDAAVQVSALWDELIRRNWLTLADVVINYTFRQLLCPLADALDPPKVFEKLDEIRPDSIICTGDGFGKVLGEYCRQRDIPLFLVLTEVSVFQDLTHPHAHHICYFPDTAEAVRSFDFSGPYYARRVSPRSSLTEKLGYVLTLWSRALNVRAIFRDVDRPQLPVNDATVTAVGPIVDARHFRLTDRRAAKQALGLEADRPCVVVASGSIGGGFVVEGITEILRTAQQPLTVLALCGRDQSSLEQVAAMIGQRDDIDVIPVGFTASVEMFFAAADAAVVRPSAGVALELMMHRVPLVVSSRTTANDRGLVSLVVRHGLGAVYQRPRGIGAALQTVLDAPGAHRDRMERFLDGQPTHFSELARRLRAAILPAVAAQAQRPA